MAVQIRSMSEDEKGKEDEEEPDNEVEGSDKDQPMSDKDNEDIEDEAEDDWRIPIHQYLDKGTLPADVKEARKIESKAAIRMLHDIHKEDADNHSGRRSLAIKAKMQGYYWLSMYEDSKNVAKRCERCQRFSRKIKAPVTELNSVISPWPFFKWGFDIVGP
ncbi:uncharacterized protein LOC113279361 [Papaver somniferum]|uniref:uncharacterized protein LOC113279361 n=1 Tax=Papaver somniferum TaxID=3469 RepID=UPI000E7050C4|nr:uncharacterized protein LOC113279361 [Papaver somniferum]